MHNVTEMLARVIFWAAPPSNPHGPVSDLVFDDPFTRWETERARKISAEVLASPVIARIKADVLRDFADQYQDNADENTPAGIDPDLLRAHADQLERDASV